MPGGRLAPRHRKVPELPEVEIAARNLRRWCQGHRVLSVRITDGRIIRGQAESTFRRTLRGRRVVAVTRHGKNVLADLGDGRAWWIHLGMTGKLVWRDPGEPLTSHTRVAVRLDPGTLCFHDPRLFGATAAGAAGRIRAIARIDELGPDALAIGRSGRRLAAALGAGRTPIKLALMDQSRLAGIGNIQASEALWRARIHPTTSVGALDAEQMRRLARGMNDALEHTIQDEDGPEITYVEEAGADNPFFVYGRDGEPCPRCEAAIVRTSQGGRGTFHCPGCQPD